MCFLGIFPVTGFLAIVLLIILKVVALRRKGISVGARQSKKQIKSYMLYLVFLLLLLLWLAALVTQAFHLKQFLIPAFMTEKLITSTILKATGAGIVLLSVLLMFVTLLHFRQSLRFGMNNNNQGKLVTSGIFSLTRNPFFLSLDFYFVGQAMVFPGILFICMSILTILSIHFFILKEEKFLLRHYQNNYFDYARKVRRYF